jgi:hypothetical protein
MNEYYNTPEEAIQALTQTLKMSKAVPQHYCQKVLLPLLASKAERLTTRHFQFYAPSTEGV